MKKYTVIWRSGAESHLTTLYLDATDRPDVTTAANTIDAILKRDPYSYSESRAGNSRIMFVPPLAVAFDVSEDDRLVSVWAVWRPE